LSISNTILVCPLNWGLGHISRDVPIIRRFKEKNFRVVVAGALPVIDFIRYEFPTIETDFFPDFKVFYSKGNSQTLKLLSQLPRALFSLYREKKFTAKLVKKFNPVLIVSDNRYGVRHPNIKSIIITHQLMLKMPSNLKFLEKSSNRLIKYLVSKFDLCWIPDNPLPFTLSGDLVHKFPLPRNAKLIGPISRFMDNFYKAESDIKLKKYDLLVIISGPEPQRTLFQQKLIANFSEIPIKCLIVSGTLKKKSESENLENIEILPHLDTFSLAHYIKNTPIVVSRAGYTTIMDLWFLKKNAILVPTPGQTEQEYIAEKTVVKNHFFVKQSKIATFNFMQFSINENDNLQQNFVDNFLDKNITEILNLCTEHFT